MAWRVGGDLREALRSVLRAVITDDRRRGIDEVASWLASTPPFMVSNVDTSDDAILRSPAFLIGSVDTVVETLQEWRERFGISYVTVFGDNGDIRSTTWVVWTQAMYIMVALYNRPIIIGL